MSQVLLVAGGGRGICAATAQLAAERGYVVCVNYRSNHAAAAVVAATTAAGGSALAVQADVSSEADVTRLFETSDARLGLLTALVNNAGIAASGARAKDAKDVRFVSTLNDDVQALAVSPDDVPPNISVQMVAIRPDGSRAPLIHLNTRPDWSRRYWFERPLSLPRGTRIEVMAKFDDPDIFSAAFGSASAPPQDAGAGPLRLTLNVVRAGSKPSAP